MRIPLDLIAPSPTPVRTTWDEDKMNELVQSIKEQGVIVPVKVRPLKDIYPCPVHGLDWLDGSYEHYSQDSGYTEGCRDCLKNVNRVTWTSQEDDEGEVLTPQGPLFELVYGHRRAEAARRAGLDEIEAIVEGVDDTTALVQALIENVQREDMNVMDKAQSLDALAKLVGSRNKVAEMGILDKRYVYRLFALLSEPRAIQDAIRESGLRPEGGATEFSVRKVREVIADPTERAEIVTKVVSEELTAAQARRIAEAVAAAPSPEAKRVLLEAQYSPVIHDPDLIKERAARYGAHDPLYQDHTPTKQQQYDQAPEVRATVDSVIDAAKRWNELIKVIRGMTGVGKLAPESRQFIAHRARQLAKTLTDWANELEAKE